MNFKFKIKKIDIGPLRIWNLGVIVFLVLIVILIVLNIYIFQRVQKDFEASGDTGSTFQPKQINKDLLKEISGDIAKRRAIFESGLINGPEI